MVLLDDDTCEEFWGKITDIRLCARAVNRSENICFVSKSVE